MATELYRLESCPHGWALRAGREGGTSVKTIDYLRTRSAAEHAARELNAGRAHVEHHRPVGCRIQPGPSTARAHR